MNITQNIYPTYITEARNRLILYAEKNDYSTDAKSVTSFT